MSLKEQLKSNSLWIIALISLILLYLLYILFAKGYVKKFLNIKQKSKEEVKDNEGLA